MFSTTAFHFSTLLCPKHVHTGSRNYLDLKPRQLTQFSRSIQRERMRTSLDNCCVNIAISHSQRHCQGHCLISNNWTRFKTTIQHRLLFVRSAKGMLLQMSEYLVHTAVEMLCVQTPNRFPLKAESSCPLVLLHS